MSQPTVDEVVAEEGGPMRWSAAAAAARVCEQRKMLDKFGA
jgi:hypothetical protein